jgi:hypothetical protein
MKKLLLAFALCASFPLSALASSTSVTRFEHEDYCFVTTTTIYDDNSIESKTIPCLEYDAWHQKVSESERARKAEEFALSRIEEYKKAGILNEVDQVLGVYPKIKWFPDLRLKALNKVTTGKTPEELFKMCIGIDGIGKYENWENSDLFVVILRLIKDGKNKAIFKEWSYHKDEQNQLQWFTAKLDFNGQEITEEFNI